MRHVAPILLAALAGCLFDPVVDETVPLRCVDDEDCPGEMACAGGRCLGPDAIAGERCGDGLIARSGAEACDDGDDNSDDRPDACRLDCSAPRCGDGVTDRTEGCDDGNAVDTDDCTSFCVPSTCGDGVVNAGDRHSRVSRRPASMAGAASSVPTIDPPPGRSSVPSRAAAAAAAQQANRTAPTAAGMERRRGDIRGRILPS